MIGRTTLIFLQTDSNRYATHGGASEHQRFIVRVELRQQPRHESVK